MRNILILLASLLPFTATGQDTLFDKNGKPRYVEIIEEVPIPPTVYTNIDNVDTKIVYTGSWVNGSTTAGGFHPVQPNSTIAYSNLAGNTSTLLFTGTYIGAFLEQKAGIGHGKASFKVDNSAETVVNLDSTGGDGSRMVFKRKLPAGQHTFKITVVGTGNVVFDYIKTDGAAVEPPIPPIPPITGDIIVNAGQSIKAAVEMAAPGKIVVIKNGGYNENIINVPVGVTIRGESKAGVIINFIGSHPQPISGKQPDGSSNYEFAIFQFKSPSKANGNQTISGLTIIGKNLATGGIIIANRDNVTVTDVKIQDMVFSGGWSKNGANAVWSYNEFVNTSWASNGWCSGELNIYNLTNMYLHHNTFKNDTKNAQGKYIRGYGIKSMWGDNTLSGIVEFNSFALVPNSIWKNSSGPNIDIEFHDTWVGAGNVYVRNNKLTNMVSATGNKTTGNAGRWIIQNNDFSLQAGSTCQVEVACNNISIIGGTMRGASIITANFVTNQKYNDCIIDGVDFVSNNANPGWGGTFLIGPSGVTNFVYKNNKITKGSYQLVKFMGVTGGVTDGGGNTIN